MKSNSTSEIRISFKNLIYKFLQIPGWQINTAQHWCVFGTNASGKGTLASLMTEELMPESGSITGLPDKVCILSFESQQAFYEKELYEEDTDFLDHIDYGTTVLEMLFEHCSDSDIEKKSQITELANHFNLSPLLNRGYRLLSSGEARKVLLLREVFHDNDLIILDEPYEGLDLQSIEDVNQLLQQLILSGKHLLLLVNRIADIPAWISHLAIQHQGRFIAQGQAEEILNLPELEQLIELNKTTPLLPPAPVQDADMGADKGDPLVKMENTQIIYDEIYQFRALFWQLNKGEHTIITGPNGAGKSTLLQLITGDHAQCYGNNLHIFGIKRGSGESIWELKKHIGIISASLHRDYRAGGNVLSTVISGLYDSIGLYTRPSEADKKVALHWLDIMGLKSLAKRGFRQLSFGQQRLVLIARGLIKQPPLVILDEPTQGLDDLNRHMVLTFIEKLADLKQTTLLFVSHRQDEHLPLFKHQLEFVIDESEDALFKVNTKKEFS